MDVWISLNGYMNLERLDQPTLWTMLPWEGICMLLNGSTLKELGARLPQSIVLRALIVLISINLKTINTCSIIQLH